MKGEDRPGDECALDAGHDLAGPGVRLFAAVEAEESVATRLLGGEG